jgi:dihydrofolate reductase
MAAVVWHVTMSADGFIAARDDAMDWVFEYFSEDENETARAVIETTGAIIMGRHTYNVEDRYRPASMAALGQGRISSSRTSRRTSSPTG